MLQGCNLGPLLFNIFVNDLVDSVQHSKVLQFADDVKIYREIHSTTDCLKMQDDVQAVLNWCLKNNLVLNPSKTKVVSFTRKTSCIEYSYTMLC